MEGSCFERETRSEYSKKSLVPDAHRARFLHSAGYYNRAPENRSEARFLGRGGAALQVEHFAKWQNADSIGE